MQPNNGQEQPHRKGQWKGKRVIIGIAIFSAIFLALLFYLATLADKTNPDLKRDILISEASGVLGLDMKVLIPKQNINSDVEDEIIALVPGEKGKWVLSADSSEVWAKQFLVMQVDGKQPRRLLYANSNAIMVDGTALQGDPEGKSPIAPYGYVVEYEENSQSKFYVFRIALSDAKGQPQSDYMIFTWDGKAQKYVLPQMP